MYDITRLTVTHRDVSLLFIFQSFSPPPHFIWTPLGYFKTRVEKDKANISKTRCQDNKRTTISSALSAFLSFCPPAHSSPPLLLSYPGSPAHSSPLLCDAPLLSSSPFMFPSLSLTPHFSKYYALFLSCYISSLFIWNCYKKKNVVLWSFSQCSLTCHGCWRLLCTSGVERSRATSASARVRADRGLWDWIAFQSANPFISTPKQHHCLLE